MPFYKTRERGCICKVVRISGLELVNFTHSHQHCINILIIEQLDRRQAFLCLGQCFKEGYKKILFLAM